MAAPCVSAAIASKPIRLTGATGDGITSIMLIYKILRLSEWQNLRRDGETNGAPVDVSDGFVHFSTIDQLSETVTRHFTGEKDLMLVAVDSGSLGDALKWEPSRGGALFPHLYRVLKIEDVHWAQPLPLHDGVHVLPPGLE